MVERADGSKDNHDYLWQPNYHEPCGARDPKAKFPEHVHYDCAECHEIVKKILIGRARIVDRRTASLPTMPRTQEKLPFMHPDSK